MRTSMRVRSIAIAAIMAGISCGTAPTPTTAALATASAAPTRSAAAQATQGSRTAWHPLAAPQGAPLGTQWLTIDMFDDSSIATAIFPSARSGPAPVILYLYYNGDPQTNGLMPRDLDFAAALAKEGFLVLVPCWGYPAEAPIVDPCAKTLSRQGPNIVKDINSIADAARTLPGARADRVVVIGRVRGGTAAVLAGSMGARIEAVVAISGAYGTPGSPVAVRFGTSVIENVDGLSVPLLIVHGTADVGLPGTSIEAVRDYASAALARGPRVETLFVEGGDDMLLFTPPWTGDVLARVVEFARSAQ